MNAVRVRVTCAIAAAVAACSGDPPAVIVDDDVAPIDAGDLDAGPMDAGPVDTGPADTGRADASDAPDVSADAGPPCNTNDDCVSPDLCTNAQACRMGRCVVVGGPAACDDGYACTDDRCDAAAGRCVHTANDMRCPGDQFCALGAGCVRELPCEVGDATCARLNSDPCAGTWSCEPARLRCVRSAPFNCDDGDACTVDACMVMGTAPMCAHRGPDYMTDLMNCGACGRACAAGANQSATCAAGSCTLSCLAGYVDVDGDPMNGCECNAAASDAPDLTFTDSNCDGVDGDAARAVFVSPRGDDTGDGTRAMPLRSLANAIALAATATPPRPVYAALGTYEGSIALVSGVSIYGGYDDRAGWSRARANATVINGDTTAVLAERLTAPVELQLSRSSRARRPRRARAPTACAR
ncbi:MAG: hypothetical protein R3A52_14180 [Polyangiales bacterium]